MHALGVLGDAGFDGNVQVVLGAAAGGRDVEAGPVGGVPDGGVGGVDGDALAAVHGGGVASSVFRFTYRAGRVIVPSWVLLRRFSEPFSLTAVTVHKSPLRTNMLRRLPPLVRRRRLFLRVRTMSPTPASSSSDRVTVLPDLAVPATR